MCKLHCNSVQESLKCLCCMPESTILRNTSLSSSNVMKPLASITSNSLYVFSNVLPSELSSSFTQSPIFLGAQFTRIGLYGLFLRHSPCSHWRQVGFVAELRTEALQPQYPWRNAEAWGRVSFRLGFHSVYLLGSYGIGRLNLSQLRSFVTSSEHNVL